MNCRRFSNEMAVRVVMAAAVLSTGILIRAGVDQNTMENETGMARKTTGTHLEEFQERVSENEYLHIVQYAQERKAETGAEEKTGDAVLVEKDLREHIIVVKERDYDNAKLRWEYEYDTAGNMITKISYNTDNGSISEQNEYEYDNMGNLIKYVSYDSAENIISQIENEYEYDKNGNKITFYYTDGGKRMQDEYEYDELGNEVKHIRYREDGSVEDRYEYEYDKMGNKIKEIHYREDDSVDHWDEYEYNATGQQISHTYYNGDGRIVRREEREYDEMGNRTKITNLIYEDSYSFHILGNLYVFRTANVSYVLEYEYEYAYID